jgi:RNA polymerase sigma-B factor
LSNHTAPIAEERSEELFQRLPDRRAREELVDLYAPLARYLAGRFRGRGESLEDLSQVAMLGLVNAIDRFDPSREVRFTTFASVTMVGEIKRHFRDRAWSVRVPRRLQEGALKISRAVPHLHQQLGRSPTIGEIGESVGLSNEEVLEAMDAMGAYSAQSLDAPTDEDGTTSLDRLRSEEPTFELLEAWTSVAPLIRELSPREKRILDLRFFQGKTQSEIAEELDISQMHVSRLLAKTLTKLREGVEGAAD